MAQTILFNWECGGGLGHVMQITPLARELHRHGWRVVAALRKIAPGSAQVFGDGIELLPMPIDPMKRGTCKIETPHTFAHVLQGVGWDSVDAIAALAASWRWLLERVKPDLVVFDHSPTALLASRGMGVRRVVIGSGFCCPPDVSPLPNLRSWEPVDNQKLIEDERSVLERANRMLANYEAPSLERIGKLYSDVDQTFLLTFRELDHYDHRPAETRYRGPLGVFGGRQPQWPAASGRRVFAYLKSFPLLPHLLIRLKGLGCPTIIYIANLDPQLREQFTCSTMTFATAPLNMRQVAQECDLAILHGGHGAAASMLLAGKPMLLLPIFLEQQLLAMKIARMGAALFAPLDKPVEFVRQLERALDGSPLTDAAGRFANQYRSFDSALELEQMVHEIEQLC